jgi:hypothetical protein
MAVKTAVKATGLVKNGFLLASVSSHSMRTSRRSNDNAPEED